MAKSKQSVSPHQLFRYATGKDWVIIILGVIGSAAAGCILPVSAIVFGNFLRGMAATLEDPSSMLVTTLPIVHTMAFMGLGLFVAGYMAQSCWIISGEAQTRRIRFKFLNSVLHQDQAWFDDADEGSLTTRLTGDMQLIQDGMSEKLGLCIVCIAQLLAGYITALAVSWKLALVIIAGTPTMVVAAIIMGWLVTKYTDKAQDSYAFAGTVAEQAFSGIRTVFAFSMQKRFLDRYDERLVAARSHGYKRGLSFGIGTGFLIMFLFCIYGLGFWYGSKLVFDHELDGPTIVVVLECVMVGSFGLMNIATPLNAVVSACAAASSVFAIIDRAPAIDPDANPDSIVADLQGDIEYCDVDFSYPSRSDVPVLRGLNLRIKRGQTVALVGSSGSGKSTTVQLLQRFYDVDGGSIKLDGHETRSLSLRWLRSQIGVVSQEPVLFNLTIRQNIVLGSPNRDVTDDQIIDACKLANCHAFISSLPHGYDTVVGENATMLSGGQKQRIAIARAVIKNPAILLLDEATSALDTRSERIVQRALDAASQNRTTLVIAHRLSSIRNADLIVVMQHGVIVEQGTHAELLDKQGVYKQLVDKQHIGGPAPAANTISAAVTADDATVLANGDDTRPSGSDEDDDDTTMSVVKDESPPMVVKEADGMVSLPMDDEKKARRRSSAGLALTGFQLERERVKQDAKAKGQQRTPLLRLFRDCSDEKWLLLTGFLAAALYGVPYPVFGLLFGQMVVSLTINVPQSEGPLEGSNLYAFLFLMVGIIVLLLSTLKFGSLEIAGERYTKKLRYRLFKAYLKQEVAFYDLPRNSTGALTSKLATDCKVINDMITKAFGDVVQITMLAIVGIVLAFYYCWQLALVTLLMSPFILIGGYVEASTEYGFTEQNQDAYADAGDIASEAIRSIRTVASLNQQSYFEGQFQRATVQSHKLTLRKAVISSFGYAIYQSNYVFNEAVCFFAGTHFVYNGWTTFDNFFNALMIMTLAFSGLGQSIPQLKTFARSKVAAISIFDMLDRQSAIDPDLEGIEPKDIHGQVDCTDIAFTYPARPDVPIFKGDFSLHGAAGKTIALVGHSGNGKSTIIGMLERWYDPTAGKVLLDEHNVQQMSLGHLRSQMALVGQEPVLFDLSIKDNIMLGTEADVSMDDVVHACKQANIYDFINSLPKGFDTRVGEKGSQLSGGQKQRIAIARALIRKPKLLLLDEATSALDSESEKIVQEALDQVIEQGNRTTVTIAHRLSTIKNADLICVIHDGKVFEQGTHDELLMMGGIYAELVQQQSLLVV